MSPSVTTPACGRGFLHLHNNGALISTLPTELSFTQKLQTCELIDISREYAEKSLDEWKLEQRPKSTQTYEFYNVIEITWENGIAYRRALGCVLRDVQGSQNLEQVAMTID